MTGQEQHARVYKRASEALAIQAGMLSSLEGPVKLDAIDVAGLFASTAASVMVTEFGHAAAVAFLRGLADKIEAGRPAAN